MNIEAVATDTYTNSSKYTGSILVKEMMVPCNSTGCDSSDGYLYLPRLQGTPRERNKLQITYQERGGHSHARSFLSF